MSIESIIILIVIISFLLLLIPDNNHIKVKEWHYDSCKHIMCIIIKDKTIKDIYFIYVNGIWYNYPSGIVANMYYSNLCNRLLNTGKPM